MTVVTNKQKRTTGDALDFDDILDYNDLLDGANPLTVYTNKSKHSVTFTNKTKNAGTWTNKAKSS